MKFLRQSNISIHRDSWVEINLENLAHNIKELKTSSNIVEIGYCRKYADGEPGTIKTVFKK